MYYVSISKFHELSGPLSVVMLAVVSRTPGNPFLMSISLMQYPRSLSHLSKSSCQRSRLIAQYLINLIHNLRRQLLHHLQRLHTGSNLLRSTGTRNRRTNIRILNNPRERESSLIATKLIRNRLQLLHLLNLLLPVISAKPLPHHLHNLVLASTQPAIPGDTIIVLPSQHSNLERGKDGKTETVIFVEEAEFALDFVAGEEVVLRLFHQRADHVKALCDGPRHGDFFAVPL